MKASINCDFERQKLEIYMREDRRFFSPNGKGGIDVVEVPLEELPKEPVKPFLTLPMHAANAFISAIMEASKEFKIPVEENHLKGKLESTERHLEDMREIAKHLIINKHE